MEGLAIALTIVAVSLFLFGLFLGVRHGRAAVQVQLDEAKDELKDLRPKVAELAAANEREKAQEEKYTQMKADVESAFARLASQALRDNNETFLNLANQKLGAQAQDAEQTLAQKEEAVRNLLQPLNQTLDSLGQQTREMETARATAYGELRTLVEGLNQTIPESVNSLRSETAQLVAALRAPKTRGNWGELQLKRCVEYAGMVEYCSFAEQVTARDGDDNILRPDMTIKLPNGREIVVDAKTPLDAFLDASGSTDPAVQKVRFEAHAQRVRSHLKDLASKAYWRQFDKAPDFVVCFLPSEALFSAALEADPSLIEFGAQSHVVLATPTTLIALLRAVEFGWQQTEITKNAKAIHEMGRRIYEKLVAAHGHVTRLGNSLANSVDSYNKFLGSIEGKKGASVFFLGRQLGELVHSDQELGEFKQLQPEARDMESQEWSQPLLDASAGEESELVLTADADESDDSVS